MSLVERVVSRYRVAQDPLRTERRIELLCLVPALLLVLQLAWILAGALLPSAPAAVEPAASALTVADQLTRRVVAPGDSAELRERPLFWEGRRPIASADTKAQRKPDRAPKLKGVRLLGVFGSGDSGGIIALVQNEQQRIRVGEEVAGWTLEQVSADGATLASGADTESLVLERSSGSISVEPPATAEPAGAPPPPLEGADELTLGGQR